ncbi:hypothetical protein [Streptomyces sp. NPDC001781]
MTDGLPQPPLTPLTDLQHARVDYARRDLDYTRTEDLSQIEPAGLILIIETLRRRLDDTLALVSEIAAPIKKSG